MNLVTQSEKRILFTEKLCYKTLIHFLCCFIWCVVIVVFLYCILLTIISTQTLSLLHNQVTNQPVTRRKWSRMWAQSGVANVLLLTHSLTHTHTYTRGRRTDGPCYTRSCFDTEDSPPWSTSRLQKVSEMDVAARTDSICDLWTVNRPLNCRLFTPLLQDASLDGSWSLLSLLGTEWAEKERSGMFCFLEDTRWVFGHGTLSLFRPFQNLCVLFSPLCCPQESCNLHSCHCRGSGTDRSPYHSITVQYSI